MSSILKALKKLEQEKAARRSGNPDITRGVLGDPAARRKRKAWLFPVSLAGVAVSAALLTYLLTAGFTTAPGSAVPGQGGEAPLVAGSEPVGRGALLKEDGTGAATEERPGKSPTKGAPDVRGQAPVLHPAAEAGHPLSPVPVTPEAVPAAAPPQEERPRGADQAHSATGRQVSTLTVTGIAWQKDGADRVAMVNGVSVGEGATVEGARVEEILPDRVRFSFERRPLEVVLGKSAQLK